MVTPAKRASPKRPPAAACLLDAGTSQTLSASSSALWRLLQCYWGPENKAMAVTHNGHQESALGFSLQPRQAAPVQGPTAGHVWSQLHAQRRPPGSRDPGAELGPACRLMSSDRQHKPQHKAPPVQDQHAQAPAVQHLEEAISGSMSQLHASVVPVSASMQLLYQVNMQWSHARRVRTLSAGGLLWGWAKSPGLS